MSKKIVSLLVLVLFTFALAGCDLFGPGTTTTTQAPTTTTTTTITTTTTSSGTTTTVTTQPSSTTTTTSTSTTTTTTSTLTTTQSTTITTTTTQDVNFQRELLLEMVNQMFGNGEFTNEEKEAQVAMMLDMAGMSSEYDLYLLLMNIPVLMTEFNEMDTLTEVQALYQHAISLGFTPTIITNLMTNGLMMMVEEESQPVDNSYEVGEILRLQAEIQLNQTQMMMIRSQVTDYCNNQAVMYAVECIAYYDALINNLNMWNMYTSHIEMQNDNEQFDFYLYHNLEYNLDQVLYYTYYDEDEYNRDLYQVAFDELYGGLSVEEKTMYDPLLNEFEVLKQNEYSTLFDLGFLFGELDSNLRPIGDAVFFDYYVPYEEMFNQNRQNEWMIHEYEYQMEERVKNQLMASVMFAYMDSESGYNKIHQAMTTFFNVFDTVVTGMDQDTFDLIMGVLMGEVVIDETTFTAENISLYANTLADILVLLESSITQTDIDNLASLGKDILAVLIANSELTVTEQAALLIKLQSAVDYYLPKIISTYDELILFLESITVEKAQLIVDQLPIIASDYTSLEGRVVAISILIEGFLSDGSLNITGLLNHLTDLYFDITTMFNPDTQMVIDVKAAIAQNVTRIIELAIIISGYDPEVPFNVDQMLILDEARARVEAFITMFKYGFESILEPIEFGYEHQDFIDLILKIEGDWMTEAEIEAEIQMYMTVFETVTEEEAYYMVMMVVQMVRVLPEMTSFTEFQDWFGQVVDLGFSNQEIAGYILNMMMAKEFGQVSDWLVEEESYVIDQIVYYTEEVRIFYEEMDLISAAFEAEVLLLDSSLQPYALNLFDVLLTEMTLSNDKSNAFYYAEGIFGWGYLDQLITVYDNWQYYLSIEDPMQASYWENYYVDMTYYMDEWEMDALNQVINTRDVYEAYYQDFYLPLWDSLAYPMYEDMKNMVGQFINQYANAYYNWINSTHILSNYNDQLIWIQEDIAREQIMVDYFADPVHQQLLEDVIAIGLDEITQLMMTANPLTFDDFFQFFFGMQREVTLMMVEEEPSGPILPDISAEQMMLYMDDISSLLHVLFTTMDEADVVKVKTLFLDMIQIQFQNEGMTEQEIIDIMAVITPNVDKYWTMLNGLITMMYTMMDGMTIEKIEVVMTYLPMIIDHQTNMLEKVGAVSMLIDTLLTDGTVDYDFMIDMVFELYFDIQYMFDYDPLVKQDVIDTYRGYIDEMIQMASQIALYDMTNLTDTELQTIFMAKELAMYLVESLQNPELIEPMVDFGYTHQDFVNLILQLFGPDMTEMEIEDQIQQFVLMFESISEEFVYYRVLLLGQMIQDVRYIDSFQDIQELIVAFQGSGVNPYLVIDYLLSQVITDFNNQLEYDYYYQHYLDAMNLYYIYESDFEQMLIDLLDSETLMLDQIALISDPLLVQLATILYQETMTYHLTTTEAYQYLSELSEYDIWDYAIFDQLFVFYFGEDPLLPDMTMYEALLYSLTAEEQFIYSEAISSYVTIMNVTVAYQNAYDTFMLHATPETDYLPDFFETEMLNYMNILSISEQYPYLLEVQMNEVRMYQEYVSFQLTFLDFISEPTNIDILRDAAYLIYDDVVNIITTTDPLVFDSIASFFMNSYEIEPTPALILMQVANINQILVRIFETYEPADFDTLNLLVDQVVISYINALDLDDSIDGVWTTSIIQVIDTHFDSILTLQPIITTFLGQLTEAKIQTLMVEIERLNLIGSEPTQEEQLITLDAMSTIIAIVFGDDSLNQDLLIQVLGGFVFDLQYALGYLDDSTTIEKVTLLQTAVNEILDQALLIYDYDYTLLNEAQLLEVNDFRIMIEEFGMLVQTLNGENMPV